MTSESKTDDSQYIKFQDIVQHLDIAKGDRVFVSSDAKKLAFSCYENGEAFSADLFIDSIIDIIGQRGTLVFPAYNWGFCKGEAFDYWKTKSKVGSITSAALNREDFRRTEHPIYSFAVWGKDADALCALDNKSSFGPDSPFAFFYAHEYKNLFIDIDYKSSATFVHHLEEKIGVPYRFMKSFEAEYIDRNGDSKRRAYSMYVRPTDIDVAVTINPMHEVFLENNAVRAYAVNGINYNLLDLRKAYDLVEEDIINNESRRVAIYPEQGAS